MDQPEYLLCINCETPCYTFEWSNEIVTEAFCTACGTDEPDEFMTDGKGGSQRLLSRTDRERPLERGAAGYGVLCSVQPNISMTASRISGCWRSRIDRSPFDMRY